jgi:hypothetical protein
MKSLGVSEEIVARVVEMILAKKRMWSLKIKMLIILQMPTYLF